MSRIDTMPPLSKCRTELFMLFRHWNKALIPPDGFMVEQKVDGWRAGWWRGLDGTARLWTKNGYAIEGIGHIAHRLAIMERIAGEPMFFDGELQIGGALLATKTWCESGWKSGGEAGTLHLFDAMPEREWNAGGSDTPLHERKARLEALHDAALLEESLAWEWREGTHGREPDAPPTVIIPHDWTMAASGVRFMAETVWNAGGEGLVLKDPASPYRRNRCDGWWKVKKEGVR